MLKAETEPAAGDTPTSEAAVPPLLELADGIPDVITTPDALATAIEAFAHGTGPVAVDAERASGFRYGQRAYLIQLRREGAGTALIDPIACPDLSELSEALVGVEWVLHAASQDLACLAEVGLHPSRLFDTELGARLLGLDRVGLAAVTAELLGWSMAKEHSAADWSTRPMPQDWLKYAALDVEVLVELREQIAERLAVAGKAAWAAEEFEHVRTAPPAAPRVEPWRRVSGTHAIRDQRRLAVVRSLWEARDHLARDRDIAPGRVLPDAAIIAAAQAMPTSEDAMTALPSFGGKGTKRRAAYWYAAVAEAASLPASELPSSRGPSTDAPPPPRAWAERDPDAAARLTAARELTQAIATENHLPVENILLPDLLRRTCWRPPKDRSLEGVSAHLLAAGARHWQVELVAGALSTALAATAAATA